MKALTFRSQNNTDATDIQDKCIGVSAWVVGDSTSKLNTNRGLHTQVRHNGNKETFAAACQLAKMYAAAPDMLVTLKEVQALLSNPDAEPADADRVSALVANIITRASGV